MNLWEYLDKRKKRKSLERLREDYLREADYLNELTMCINQTNWSAVEKDDQYLYMFQKIDACKKKAQELEKEIRSL